MSVEENLAEKLQKKFREVTKVERGARKIERVVEICKHFAFTV
jgi:hypothetical protein